VNRDLLLFMAKFGPSLISVCGICELEVSILYLPCGHSLCFKCVKDEGKLFL